MEDSFYSVGEEVEDDTVPALESTLIEDVIVDEDEATVAYDESLVVESPPPPAPPPSPPPPSPPPPLDDSLELEDTPPPPPRRSSRPTRQPKKLTYEQVGRPSYKERTRKKKK